MPQRTDFLDIGRLGLTSGEGRRLDVHVHVDPLDYGGSSYAVEPELMPVRLDISRTTGDGWALRMRFDAELEGPCMRCLDNARRTYAVDSYEVHQPGAGDADLLSPYYADHELNLAGVGARRARARPADPDHVPRGLRRPVRAVRREPQRGPRSRARGAAGPALGEAVRTQVRLAGRYPFAPSWPSLSKSNRTRAPHSVGRSTRSRRPRSTTARSAAAPRRPHRVCGNCGFYGGREVVHMHDAHDHDHEH